VHSVNENKPRSNSENSISNLTKENVTESNAIQIPEIALPKGGGALKGIDEKFQVNNSNGTASFEIPLPITSGRNGFSPSLSLNYNSGGSNSPLGLGWSLNYPMIQRKTDKGLPRYQDDLEDDIFMFTGAEDLVPFLERDDTGNYRPLEKTIDDYTIKRYRPRIEGLFARIEKITHSDHGIYWKVTTRDNVTTFLGKSRSARISNPENRKQIFQWKPEFSYDDKGNWIHYDYKEENVDNVPDRVYERNRKVGLTLFSNTYLKRIKYGNRKAFYANKAATYDFEPPATAEAQEYFFEVVFDYGEHRPADILDVSEVPTYAEQRSWSYRQDAFSSYRSGFEIRTYRRCFGVLMFHSFEDETQLLGYNSDGSSITTPFGAHYLVCSLDFEFEPAIINEQAEHIDGINAAEVVYLKTITQSGYIRKEDNTYAKKSLPPMELTYEKLHWNTTLKTIHPEQIVNAPAGLTNNYQWVDLYGEGIAGILAEQGNAWYYKSNLGSSGVDQDVTFSVAKEVISKSSSMKISIPKALSNRNYKDIIFFISYKL